MATERSRSWAFAWTRRGLAAIAFALCLVNHVDAQTPCVGDCDGNRVVSVDELVRGVSIALNRQEVSTCTAFDPNESGTVTVNELVQGVNSALRGCFPPVSVRGLCRIPSASGLIPCTAGSGIRLSLCLNRARCLFDPSARRVLRNGTLGADGRYFFSIDDEAILRSLLLVESDVATGVTYRALAFGPAAAGATIENFDVDPIREAIARLFVLRGLDQFTDLSISEIIGIVANALAALNFAGQSPQGAADLALNTANQNGTIQQAFGSRQFTPTATFTVTRTATAAHSATPTATPTLTPTTTITQTPSVTLTASQTPTQTATSTASSTATATATVTNTATITGTATTTATPTASSSPTATLPPLNVAIEVNPDPIRPGETVEISVTVSNTGGSTIGPVDVSMVLPDTIEPFSDTLASGIGRCGPGQLTICDPGDTLTWFGVTAVEPGKAIAVRVPPIVAPGTPNGSMLTFSVTANANGMTAADSYSAVVQASISFPFDLALNQDTEPVQPGTDITYTVSYGYRAVVGQADTMLRVHPPVGTTFVNATDGGNVIPSGEIEWNLGVLTPGDGGIRRFTVALDDNVPVGSIVEAQATIQRSDASASKHASAVSWVEATQALELQIEANPDPVRPGESIETAISVLNPGSTSQMIRLELVVPDQIDSLTDKNVTGDGSCGPFTPGNPCERRARVRWNLTIPPRDGVTVRADPVVSAGAVNGSLINLQARVTTISDAYVTAARSAVRVDTGSIFELYLDDSRDPVGVQEIYRYRLSLRHRPSDPMPVDTVLSLRLPSNTTLIDGNDGTLTDATIAWNLGSLASNTVVMREVTVQVAPGATAGSVLSAEATVRAAADALLSTRARTLTRIAQGSPIALSAMLHSDPVRPGEVLQTELTVTNSGTTSINGARTEVYVPADTDAFAEALSNGAACSPNTRQCTPGEIARWTPWLVSGGQSATIHLPPIVSAATPDGTLLRLHARVADVGQGFRDAVTSRTILVDSETPFDLSVNESDDPITPGQTLDYTVHFGRRAAGGNGDVVLLLELPPGVFFVSSADGGVAVDNLVKWELGPVPVGDGGSRTATVVVDTLPAGTPLTARAIIMEDGAPTTAKRDDVVTVAAASPFAFTLAAAPDPVAPGGLVTVSIAVTNNTGAPAFNLTVEGLVPPEANAFQDTATTGGGICGPFGSNACSPRSRVIFPIATIAAGQTIMLTMPPMIRNDVAPGTVVRFVARFQENIATPPRLATDAVTVAAP